MRRRRTMGLCTSTGLRTRMGIFGKCFIWIWRGRSEASLTTIEMVRAGRPRSQENDHEIHVADLHARTGDGPVGEAELLSGIGATRAGPACEGEVYLGGPNATDR